MAQHLVLIAARADNGVIGRDNALPWRIPADLKRFKALTMGTPMMMAGRTFPRGGGLLPGRRHIVLTRDGGWTAPGAEPAGSIGEALRLTGEASEIAVIGGAEIYALFLPLADRIELTEVHGEFAGDAFMPPLGAEWQESLREDHPALGDVPAHSFVTLERKPQ